MADDPTSSLVRTDFGELSDAELLRGTREGSRRAYAALWARHSVGALKYAKTLSISDADDLVSEAFLKVYAAIKAGGGPGEDFRFYLRAAVRNTHVSMVRARRTTSAGESIDDVVGDYGAEVASITRFDGSATARAFLSLPERWQQVLWYTEVEGLPREETAARLGIKANAVSALSFRAREALRTAWLQQHIGGQNDLNEACENVTPLFGAYSRQGVARRDRMRVERHLSECVNCTSVVDDLSGLLTPGRLAMVLLPVVAAGGGVAAFAAKFATGSALTSTAAIAAPTATVVASVGGSGAATGAAALSVVGKVAACALVATLIVPPIDMLSDSVHRSAASQTGVLEAGSLMDAVRESTAAGSDVGAPAGSSPEDGSSLSHSVAAAPDDDEPNGGANTNDEPAEPGKSAGAGKQGEPGKSANAGKPGKSAEAGKPAEPGKSAGAGKPGRPGKSVDAGKPADAGKNAEPGSPSSNRKTTQGAKSAEVKRTKTASTSAEEPASDSVTEDDDSVPSGD